MQYWDSAYGAVKRLIAAGLMVPLLGIGIVYTGSRGGMLTALAILGLYTLSKFHLSLTKLVLMLSIASAGMMLGPAYLTSTSDSSGSAQHRVEMWAEGIEMVSQNPILGIGKGYFLSYTNKLIAHNSAIEVMGETGFVGMFFWFGILYMGIRNIVSRVKESNSPSERSLLVGIGLSIVGYYVSSLFVTLEYETIYCLLGLSAAVAGWTVKSEPYSVRDFKIMISIMIGYFVLIKLFVMMYF
jgi:O-antigen ligase